MLDNLLRRFKKDNGIPTFIEYNDKKDKNWDLIPLGITKNKETIYWDLDNSSHIAFFGSTGSGKSMNIGVILTHINKYKDKFQVNYYDPFRVDVFDYQRKFVDMDIQYIYYEKHMLSYLKSVRKTIEDRYKMLEDLHLADIHKIEGQKDIVVIIESLSELLHPYTKDTDPSTYDSIYDDFSYLLKFGTSKVGFHLVIVSYNETLTVLSKDMKDLITTCVNTISLQGIVHTMQTYYDLFNEYIDNKSWIRGRGFIKINSGIKSEIKEYQGFYIDLYKDT